MNPAILFLIFVIGVALGTAIKGRPRPRVFEKPPPTGPRPGGKPGPTTKAEACPDFSNLPEPYNWIAQITYSSQQIKADLETMAECRLELYEMLEAINNVGKHRAEQAKETEERTTTGIPIKGGAPLRPGQRVDDTH